VADALPPGGKMKIFFVAITCAFAFAIVAAGAHAAEILMGLGC